MCPGSGFEFIKKVCLFVFAAYAGASFDTHFGFKLHHELFLAGGKVLGNINYNADFLVTLPPAVENLNSLASEGELLAGLSACGDINKNIAVEGGDPLLIAESRLSK